MTSWTVAFEDPLVEVFISRANMRPEHRPVRSMPCASFGTLEWVPRGLPTSVYYCGGGPLTFALKEVLDAYCLYKVSVF